MAMTYLEMWELRKSVSFHNRVVVACVKSAQAILSEGAAPKHAGRLRWANTVLVETSIQAERMMWAIIADATINTVGDAATDVQVQTAVDAVLNQFIPDVIVNTVGDGIYVTGAKLTTSGVNGSVTISSGVVTAITQAS